MNIMLKGNNEYHALTKLPESGDLCGNNMILPYRSPDKSCFVLISYCLMILCHFQLRYLRLICIYYCIYLLKSECRNTPNCTIMLYYLCDIIITSDIIDSIVK